jgi:cytochrome c5
MSRKLFAITALFDTPNDIIAATEKVRDRKYVNWDVNTPYPVHGMDDAMGLKPSKLAWVTLVMHLFGGCFAMGFMYIIMEHVYPLNIGGKPYFSLPAFVPITFAFAVLNAVIGTVAAMLIGFCRLPFNNHPINDTEYGARTMSDRFGIVIEVDNEGFDIQEVKAFLTEIGGSEIGELYEHEQNNIIPLPNGKKFIWNEGIFAFILLIVASVVSVKFYAIYNQVLYDRIPIIHVADPITGFKLNDLEGINLPIGPFTWMDVQPKEKVQSVSKFFSDGHSAREPVPHTVPRGFMPYRYSGDPAGAEANLVNPVAITTKFLAKGREKYSTYCSMCHGYFGDGNVRLKTNKFAPPSLHSEKLKNAGDGIIYHVITEGQNTMPGYAKQVSREDRWKIVHYIRTLQRAKDAKESDLK